MEVVAMTSFTQADLVQGALQAGAAGYLLKDAEADEVAAAIPGCTPWRGASGRGDRQAADAVVAGPKPQTVQAFTDREREVLVLVAQGLSNRQIADSRVISFRLASQGGGWAGEGGRVVGEAWWCPGMATEAAS
jgi:DNA-binding NarL/FixJ family response regulator